MGALDEIKERFVEGLPIADIELCVLTASATVPGNAKQAAAELAQMREELDDSRKMAPIIKKQFEDVVAERDALRAKLEQVVKAARRATLLVVPHNKSEARAQHELMELLDALEREQ